MPNGTTTAAPLQELIAWIKGLEIKSGLKLALRHLADYAGNRGFCFPSIGRIAKEMGVHRITAQRYITQLAKLGLIRIRHRFRDDGGRSSSIYEFRLQAPVANRNNKKRKAKSKQITCSPSSSDADYKSSGKKAYRIEPDKMKSREEALRHYKIAIKNKWVEDSPRNQLSYFASWAKVVRLAKEGRVKNAASMMVYVIKQGIIHEYPADCDEQKALNIIRGLRLANLI